LEEKVQEIDISDQNIHELVKLGENNCDIDEMVEKNGEIVKEDERN